MNCCGYDCHQGRDCPARAAKPAKVKARMPKHPTPLRQDTWRVHLKDLARAVALVIAAMFVSAFAVVLMAH